MLQFDRARGGNLLGDSREEPGLHRVARDRRIVLDDDLDVDRLRQRGKVAQHGVGIQFRHARRTDHHGRGPGILGMLAIADAGRGSFGGRARDDANAPGDMPCHNLEHPLTFRIVQAGHFTGHAKDGHPVHAGIYEKVDHAAQAGIVEIASRGKRRREHRVHAFEFQAILLAVRISAPQPGPANS